MATTFHTYINVNANANMNPMTHWYINTTNDHMEVSLEFGSENC